jgi:hypothetical protein
MRYSYPARDVLSDWHPWFAWHPVRVRPGDGSVGPLVWLETVHRRRDLLEGYNGTHSAWWYRLWDQPAPALSAKGQKK